MMKNSFRDHKASSQEHKASIKNAMLLLTFASLEQWDFTLSRAPRTETQQGDGYDQILRENLRPL
eukprot:scaffold17876_cov58-Cylindrotheca_fusiformis.AAC.1